METWLVTGGAGFIGSNFVHLALARTDARVVVLDKLTYAGSLRNLAPLRTDARFRFEQADIADPAAVAALFERERPRAVLNFAAETHVDRSIEGPAAFIHTNVVGTFELLEAARRHWSGLAAPEQRGFRFLHVSTDEVYGSLGPEGAFQETTPYAPNSPYAASKAAADHLVRAYHVTYGLPTLVTNCSNNFGPYQFPEKLIPLMILNAVEGRPLPIYGDGRQVRDWIYVEDHCAGVLAVLERGRVGEHYHLGAGQERTNLEMVDLLCARLEAQRPAAANPALAAAGVARYADLKRYVADRPGHDRRYAIDAAKARREFGWSPRHGLEEALDRTVAWYLEHRDWCREVQREAAYGRERLGLSQAPPKPPARAGSGG